MPKYNFIQKNSLIFSTLTNSLLFLLIYSLIPPYFRTNDDVGMMLRAAGISAVTESTPYIIFSNIAVGHALKFLYEIMPNISWYGIYQVSLLFISHTMLLNALIRLKNSWFIIPLYFVFFMALSPDILVGLQFTTVSTVSIVSGLICLIFNKDEKTFSFTNIISLFLIVTGSLVRWNTLILSLGLLIPISLSVFAVKNTQKQSTQKIFLLMISIFFAVGFRIYNNHQYSKIPEWKSFQEFNALRIEFIDYDIFSRVTDNQQNEVLRSVGWTENDYKMMKSWFFADPAVYSTQNLRSIRDQIPTSTNFMVKKNLKIIYRKVLLSNYGLKCILILFVFLIFIQISKKSSIIIFANFAITCIFFLYLIFFKKEPPDRVYISIFYFNVIAAMFLFESSEKLIRIKTTVILIGLIITTVRFNSIHGTLIHKSKNLRETNDELKSCLERLVKPNNDLLFVRWAASFPWESVPPFQNLDYLRNFHEFGLGSTQRTPDNQKILMKYGVTDIYNDLYTKENLRLVTYKSQIQIDMYRTYVQQHYMKNLQPRLDFACKNFSVYQFREIR
jgi:hypothetical protein